MKTYREQGLALFKPKRDMPAGVPWSLKHDGLRLADLDLFPLGEPDADPRDALGVACRAHDGRSEPLAERLVAADVIAVVVRVQNKVQPPTELCLDKL